MKTEFQVLEELGEDIYPERGVTPLQSAGDCHSEGQSQDRVDDDNQNQTKPKHFWSTSKAKIEDRKKPP